MRLPETYVEVGTANKKGSYAHAVGVGIGDEGVLEHGLDQVAQRVVHHPVAERRGGELPNEIRPAAV